MNACAANDLGLVALAPPGRPVAAGAAPAASVATDRAFAFSVRNAATQREQR